MRKRDHFDWQTAPVVPLPKIDIDLLRRYAPLKNAANFETVLRLRHALKAQEIVKEWPFIGFLSF